MREDTTHSEGILPALSAWGIIALAFLLPFFFIPSASFPLQFSKSLILFVISWLAFIFWIVDSLKKGVIVLPKSYILLSALSIALFYLLSGLFSVSPASSILGQGLEIGTFAAVATAVLLFFLSAVTLNTRPRLFYAHLLFMASFIVLVIYQGLRLFLGPDFLSFGVFNSATSTLIGNWNNLSGYFGLGAVMSLIGLEVLNAKNVLRWVFAAALLLSVFFLVLTNFSVVWGIVGVFSLILFVYSLVFKINKVSMFSPGWPVASLLTTIVSILFIVGGSFFGSYISDYFGINQIDARPSWTSTALVVSSSLSEDFFLGAGPNRFANLWWKYKPESVNNTIFWNVDFNSGVGFLPSVPVTAGALGALAWLSFISLFVYIGFKSILAEGGDQTSKYLTVSSFLATLYLMLFSFFYVPNVALFSLQFFFAGVFLAILLHEGLMPKMEIPLSGKSPRMAFAGVFALIVFLIASVGAVYGIGQRFFSTYLFQKYLSDFAASGDVAKAEAGMDRLSAWSGVDTHYQFASQVKLSSLNAALSGNLSQDEARARLQDGLSQAIFLARKATEIDPANYQNWIALGRVYEAIVPLGIEGAYENGRRSYEEALRINPKNPEILLHLARIETVRGDNGKARQEIGRALSMKTNYTDAIFLLSQIELNEGNLKEAISSVETAAIILPNDPTVFFRLGLLRYNDADWGGAVGALERAVSLNPVYANAKYFLGLSYNRLGRDSEAIRQFSDIEATNPNNAEVKSILANLRAGRNPLSGVKPPLEDRVSPPIEEE